MGSLYRKTKGGRDLGWYAAFVEVDGRRRHVATRQPTRQAAKVFLAEIEAKVRRGLVGVPERLVVPTVAELAERWLAARQGPKAARRQRAARLCLARVLPQLGGLRADRLLRSQVTQLCAELCARYAANTVRVTMATLAAVLAAAVHDGILSTNVARGIVLPQRESALEWLTASEAARLLELAEQRSARSLRDGSRYAALALALLCGLRRGEIFGLRWCDLDLDGRRLVVLRSYAGTPKSGEARHLPLPEELLPILCAWRDRCPKTPAELVCPVLHTSHRTWGLSGERTDHGLRRLLAAAGCKPLRRGWHALRHTFASLYVQAGGDLYTLSKLLGHASVAQSEVYAHLGLEHLAAARARLRLRG
ncbi:MAG: site-specific integrase [Polyangia bacterium]